MIQRLTTATASSWAREAYLKDDKVIEIAVAVGLCLLLGVAPMVLMRSCVACDVSFAGSEMTQLWGQQGVVP
jgi:hypothetical protein